MPDAYHTCASQRSTSIGSLSKGLFGDQSHSSFWHRWIWNRGTVTCRARALAHLSTAAASVRKMMAIYGHASAVACFCQDTVFHPLLCARLLGLAQSRCLFAWWPWLGLTLGSPETALRGSLDGALHEVCAAGAFSLLSWFSWDMAVRLYLRLPQPGRGSPNFIAPSGPNKVTLAQAHPKSPEQIAKKSHRENQTEKRKTK